MKYLELKNRYEEVETKYQSDVRRVSTLTIRWHACLPLRVLYDKTFDKYIDAEKYVKWEFFPSDPVLNFWKNNCIDLPDIWNDETETKTKSKIIYKRISTIE